MSDDLYNGPSLLAPASANSEKLARWLIWPLLLALFLITIVFYTVFTPVRVVGESMEPSLLDGDRILRTKEYDSPNRGDVVIIDTRTASDRDDVVKRVVALPGDVVEIRDNVAFVNGVMESTEHLLLLTGEGVFRDELTVPPGYVYVLGDNRPVSLDSRYLGPIPLDKVRGRASFVFLPPGRFGSVR